MESKFIPNSKELEQLTGLSDVLLNEFWLKYQEFYRDHGNLFQHFKDWREAMGYFIPTYCVAYQIGYGAISHIVNHQDHGMLCSLIGNGWMNRTELSQHYGAEIVFLHKDTAIRLERERYIRPVKDVAWEEFEEMLNAVPPIDQTGKDGFCTFKVGELLVLDICDIYAAKFTGKGFDDGRYFNLRDSVHMTHEEIVARVKEFIS